MSADVLGKPDTIATTGEGDHDRMAHYFTKADIERAYIDGAEIVALCGKRDIPLRDPNQFKTCPTCQEVLNGISE